MDDTKIKIIRKMPDGAKLFELWIGILCLAMKSSRAGTLEIGVGIPFTEETLAEHLDIPLKTTRMGLQVFNKFHMIEVWSDGTIFISNFEKHQELEKIEKNKELTRIRVAKFREKQKILLDVASTDALRNESSNDIDKDKDTDKEIDTEVTESYSEDEIQKLWIRTFGRNPKYLEVEATKRLIQKFGDKVYSILKNGVENNFNSIFTLEKNIDNEGNIIPKDKKLQGRTIESNPA